MAYTLMPFRQALLAGMRRGQRLNCALATLEPIRQVDVVTSGGAWRCYRYANRLTGDVQESSALEALVDRWMDDLERSTRLSTELNRKLLVGRGPRREAGDGSN